MTTINSSVLASLTGGDSPFIKRALTLINDQRLSSLEPLRRDLANGTTIVRLATSTDVIPANAHAIFMDPPPRNSSGQITGPGQIVVRAEYLSLASDNNVLHFVDDLIHEGRGHGDVIRVEARRAAARALIDSSGSSTPVRGDAYVKAWLDDETASRYEAYRFRKELAGLNTEYAWVNKLRLATDEMYVEFTRLERIADELGLTGPDRTSYVIENARGKMAADTNHFYRDVASKYVIDTLRLNGTQEGADYLAHAKQTFNVIGCEVMDPVAHDDGSWSASVVYENGNRTDLVFDSTGTLFQRSETVAHGDGSTTRTVTNAAGSVLSTSRTQRFDDGSTLTTTTASGGMTLAATDANGTLAHEGSFVSDGTGDGSSGTLTESIDGRSVVFNATLAADGRLHLDAIASVNGQPPRDAALVNAAFDELDVDLTSYWDGENSGAVHQLIAAADATDANGFTPAPGSRSGVQTAWYATADALRFGDALTSVQSLIAGIKSGKPLPIATGVFGIAASVLRHARLDANGQPLRDANGQLVLDTDFPLLADASHALGSINAAIGLRSALERGDSLGAINSGAILARDTLRLVDRVLEGQIASLAEAGSLSAAASLAETQSFVNSAANGLGAAISARMVKVIGNQVARGEAAASKKCKRALVRRKPNGRCRRLVRWLGSVSEHSARQLSK